MDSVLARGGTLSVTEEEKEQDRDRPTLGVRISHGCVSHIFKKNSIGSILNNNIKY